MTNFWFGHNLPNYYLIKKEEKGVWPSKGENEAAS